jgi:16S rRNA G966 N2-methylase RsmD
MDYSKKTIAELKALCKERKVKGFSKCTNKASLITLLEGTENTVNTGNTENTGNTSNIVSVGLRQEIVQGDVLDVLPTLATDSAQIVVVDPPYNTGKDFGNNVDKKPMDEYLVWCERWIKECLRILRD